MHAWTTYSWQWTCLVVIAGLGQGGALAIPPASPTGRSSQEFSAIQAGWICAGCRASTSTCANRDTPLMIIHGNEDDFAAHDFAIAEMTACVALA